MRVMKRNFGFPNATRRSASGAQPLTASHHDANSTRVVSNAISLARHLPPGLAEPNLAVIRDSSFLQKHELNPVERLDADLDHREFAAFIMLGVFLTLFFGVPLAIAVAMLDWG